MSTYYEFKGSLTFPSATAARAAFETMIGNDESIYYLPPGIERKSKTLVVEGDTLVFNSAGFAGGEPFYTTQSLVKQVVGGAIAGRVRSQEGDGGPGSYVEYYGFKPKPAAKTTKAPARKTTKAPARKATKAPARKAAKPAAKKAAKPAAKKAAKPAAKKKR